MGHFLNITRIGNAVPITLYSRVAVNDEIVVLNCQKCNQCLKCHKSLGYDHSFRVFSQCHCPHCPNTETAMLSSLKGHKSPRVLYGSVYQQCVVVTRPPIELSLSSQRDS